MSHETFKVGDKVEFISAKKASHCDVRVGDRGVVDETEVRDPRYLGWVGVTLDDGQSVYCRRHCIRKLPPPQRESTSTWDDVIVWRPKETSHV